MEYYVIPTIGQFKVTITPQYNFYNKHIVDYTILNVGGNVDKCVNITIHPKHSPRHKELLLSWAEVIDKDCTVNSQVIKGDATVIMVRLAFTIAREIAPYAEYVTLHDMSYIMCKTPDGKKKISLPPYHIAFYDKTWYEDKFAARLRDEKDYARYQKCIQAMYLENDVDTKPSSFHFGNNDIRDLLVPHYIKSKSWKQFFMLIDTHYPDTKCALMYPWIGAAIGHIFKVHGGGDLYTGKEWVIQLEDIPIIHYYQLDKKHVVGGGFTKRYEIQYYPYRDIEYNNVLQWDMHTFMKQNAQPHLATRKRRVAERKKRTIKNHVHGLTF